MVLSSTVAFGWRATASWIATESWLPRTKMYGTPSCPMLLTYEVSALLPQSTMSPVSTTASISHCFTTVRMTPHEDGLRCRSDTCRMRVVLVAGSNTGSADTVV
jgi:hypothetical protein